MNAARQRKQAEQERVEAAAQAQGQWLAEYKAWNWQWPGDGEEGFLPRNCWFTNNPKPKSTSKAPGTSQRIYGTQSYYGVPTERRAKRKSRRKAAGKRLAGLKMGGGPNGQGHGYPARTAGG